MKYFNKKNLRTYYLMMLRDNASPEIIAKSAAIGLFVAFFIPVGLQIPLALLFAYLLKARKIVSLIFTLPTNIYTIIFIYPVQCWVGGKLLRINLSYSALGKTFNDLSENFSFPEFLELGTEIIAAFFAGGLLFGVLCAIIGYFTVYGIVMSYRQRRKKRLAERLISHHQQ